MGEGQWDELQGAGSCGAGGLCWWHRHQLWLQQLFPGSPPLSSSAWPNSTAINDGSFLSTEHLSASAPRALLCAVLYFHCTSPVPSRTAQCKPQPLILVAAGGVKFHEQSSPSLVLATELPATAPLRWKCSSQQQVWWLRFPRAHLSRELQAEGNKPQMSVHARFISMAKKLNFDITLQQFILRLELLLFCHAPPYGSALLHRESRALPCPL